MPDLIVKQHAGAIDKDASGLGERDVAFILSTEDEDRDHDVIHQGPTDAGRGWVLDNFQQNRMALFAHDYRSEPIGRWDQVGVRGGKLRAVLHFVEPEVDGGRADRILRLVKGGYLNAASVGFAPIKYVYDVVRGGSDYYEQELLEASVVPVPAAPGALVEVRSVLGEEGWRAFGTELARLFDVAPVGAGEIRGVIGYKRTPLADPDTPWDAGKEVAAASVEDLRVMCCWYAGDGTKKTQFKLPHHHAHGHACVWRGVAAAAGRLSQTSLPAGDVPGVKRHLAGHYKDFGKEAPWKAAPAAWTAYEGAVLRLKAITGEVGEDRLAELLAAHGFGAEASAVRAEGDAVDEALALLDLGLAGEADVFDVEDHDVVAAAVRDAVDEAVALGLRQLQGRLD
jgi:HK97 family phage prohead protease